MQAQSPGAHESMRLQMERARAHAPRAAMLPGYEERILSRGRDAIAELPPGEEFLVTAEQLAEILEQSVASTSDPHEQYLLKLARRLPKQKTQAEHRPLSIVKTNTQPAFAIVLQTQGLHSPFLLQHMRGAGQHALHADGHEPIGTVLEQALRCALE